jgi:hypothetical protein
MFIHTINFGYYKKINISNQNIKIWTCESIKDLIKEKYSKYLDFYNNQLLIKSKENIAKLFILYEFGGLYINWNLLTDKFVTESFLLNATSSLYNIVLWKNHYQHDILKKIYGISKYVSDEILFFKSSNNPMIPYILDKINLEVIPSNEYENKLNLGDVFLSTHIINFCNEKNININTNTNTEQKLENKFDLSNLFSSNNSNKEKSDNNSVKIKSCLPVTDTKYKMDILYPVPELTNPDIFFSSWNNIFNIIVIIENIIAFYFFQKKDIKTTIVYLLVITIINFIIIYLIKSSYKVQIHKAIPDNKIFFNPKNYKILNHIKKNWKVIASEAKFILSDAPELNISRKYEEWRDSNDYINELTTKYGWVTGWKYSNDLLNTMYTSEEISSNPEINSNHAWKNFGLIHNKFTFTENVKKCPRTYKLLKKIKKYINISGFSLMKENCLLDKHTDDNGLKNNSLAYHLGLVIPSNNKTCKLIIKSPDDNKLYYMEENAGDAFVFDATHEHYAYNQSNENRIILYIDFKIK